MCRLCGCVGDHTSQTNDNPPVLPHPPKPPQVCNARLSTLIQLVLGELSPGDRTKIISLITLDVHARDVVRACVCMYIYMCVYVGN